MNRLISFALACLLNISLAIASTYNLRVEVTPNGAGSLNTTGGSYEENSSIYLRTYGNTGYVFKGWYEGETQLSSSTSFNYTMPSRDALVQARYEFDPAVPSDPEVMNTQYTVNLFCKPIGGGSFNTSSATAEEGSSVHLYAYPNTGYKFIRWENETGETVSTEQNFYYVIPHGDSNLYGIFEFDPAVPVNPNKNYWNKELGEVIVDDFTPGYLSNAISEVIRGSSSNDVKTIRVAGVIKSNDFGIANNYPNCTLLDLSRVTGVSEVPSYAFDYTNLQSVYLPATIEKIGYRAFYECKQLSSLTIYAMTPPTLESNVFKNVPEGLVVYVPAAAIAQYQDAEGWKDFTLLPIREVPNPSFEVTPDDPEGWNDLSRPHRLSLNGSYESPAGLDGVIDYAVENSEEWIALTDTLKSGDKFTASLLAMFDATKATHVIKLRSRDLVGNTSMLQPIEYIDISFHELMGVEDKTFTGDSLFQTDITCDLNSEQYILTAYRNNVDAGTASFNLEGVFPYTIGRKTYTFTIYPQQFSGEIMLTETAFVYNGKPFTPNWQFTNNNYAELEYDKDYTVDWSNNKLPGTANLTVTGKNNYTGLLSANFTIDKAQLDDELYTLILPDEDITYDEQSHGASITLSEGVGEATITYLKQGESESTTTKPTEAGHYTIYLEIADGSLYYGRALAQIGSFAIYQFNADEWAILQTVLPQLKEMGWSEPWDASLGMKSVSSIQGLIIEKGHVTGFDLNNQNLVGSFPFTILTLPQLENIDLSNNNLSGDLGTDAYAFTQQHPEQIVNIKILNISGNQLSGNISPFANIFPSLTSLNASDNCFEEVNPAISPSVIELDLSKQTISRIIPFDLESLFIDDITANVPTILLYDHVNQTYIDDIDLLCTADDNSWGMTMSYLNGQLSIPYVSGQNTYYGKSGDTFNVEIKYKFITREGCDFRIQLLFNEGDGNFDGQVDVLDLQTSILYIMEKYPTRPFNFTAANLWKDDEINVQDIICLVNQLMTTEQAQTTNARRNAPSSTVASDAIVYVQDGKLMFNSCRPIAAFDLRLNDANSLNAASNLKQMGITFVTMKDAYGLHVIAYSLNGACIPTGISTIGTIDSMISPVSHAMLSDSEANAITVSFSGATTSIENICSPAKDRQFIYDLQGRQVNESSQKGLYVKNGHKIIK